MSITDSDTFDYTLATLGPKWTERTGANLGTDMSANGASATADSAARHVATMDLSRQADHYISCWVQRPNSAQQVGVCLRFINEYAYYYACYEQIAGVDYLSLYRGTGYAIDVLIAQANVNVWFADAQWWRISAEVIGDRFRIFADDYETPAIDVTDTYYSGASGYAGLFSNTTATGIATTLWNDCCIRNGDADDLHVSQLFNGGAKGAGWGSSDRPDVNIGLGLNNPGLRQTSTLYLDDATITSVGHTWLLRDEKFAGGAFSFPTYDAATGEVAIAGTPNLTIESGYTGGRTTLSNALDRAFFFLQDDCTGVLFRSLDYRMSGFAAANAFWIDAPNSPNDHSLGIHKCSWEAGNVIGMPTAPIRIRSFFDQFDCRLCYGFRAPGIAGIPTSFVEFAWAASGITLIFQDVVFQGPARYGAYFIQVGPPAAGSWQFNHITFADVRWTALGPNTQGIDFVDFTLIFGDVVVSNNSFASTHAVPLYRGTDALFAGGVYTGTTTAHNNTYRNVTTPRGLFGFVINGGNEIDASIQDPWDLAAGTYLWPQANNVLLGTDFRPINTDYLANSSDAHARLGVLDRGALQAYLAPAAAAPRLLPTRRTADFCVSVIYDYGAGGALDLSSGFVNMRPLTEIKDILARKYKAADTELEFADPDGLFVDTNPLSFLVDGAGDRDWRAKPVRVEFLDATGASLTSYLGFVLGVRAEANKGYLRLGNRFQQLFEKPLLANDAGRIEDDAGAAGTPTVPPVGGRYVADLTPGPGCGIEEWTITFLTANTFSVKGSITGDDGSGSTAANFTSDSGRLLLAAADWVGLPLVVPGSCKIKSVWRSQTATTVIEMYEEILISPEGGALLLADLDDSVTQIHPDGLRGSIVDRPIAGIVFDTQIRVIAAMEQAAWHALAVGVPKPDGKIGIYAYVPVFGGALLDTICKHSDLMRAVVDSTPIYNEFTYRYDYDEVATAFDEERVFPLTDAANDSLARYGVRLAAPQAFELRAFDASAVDWVATLMEQNYVRWKDPHGIANVTLKGIERMGLEMDDVMLVDSDLPAILTAYEPAQISKSLVPEPRVDAVLYDVDFYVQPEGACGYCFCDAAHQCDDCWVCF